jgi:hypothetical protein
MSYLKEVVERIPAGQVQKEFQKKISDNPSLIAAPSNASFSKL